MSDWSHLRLRELDVADFDKGFLDVLRQLTVVGDITEATFRECFSERQGNGCYSTLVIEDTDEGRVIGTATLFVERKYIRACGKAGHIEDVVVDSSYRGAQLGKRLLAEALRLAKQAGCYKVILDCSEDNASFYAKCGLKRKDVQMVKYF